MAPFVIGYIYFCNTICVLWTIVYAVVVKSAFALWVYSNVFDILDTILKVTHKHCHGFTLRPTKQTKRNNSTLVHYKYIVEENRNENMNTENYDCKCQVNIM